MHLMAMLSFVVAICLFCGAHVGVVGEANFQEVVLKRERRSSSSPCSADEMKKEPYLAKYELHSHVLQQIVPALREPTVRIYPSNYRTFTEATNALWSQTIPNPSDGALSLAGFLNVFQDNPHSGSTCYFFLYGEGVRNMLLGLPVSTISIRTSCDISLMWTTCKKNWGNEGKFCQFDKETNTLQIGDPLSATASTILVSPVRDLAVPLLLKSDQFGQLDYTTNSLLLDINPQEPKDWGIIDVTGNGFRDTCNKKIRIPVSGADSSTWIGNKNPTVLLRYWQLRALDYTPADQNIQPFVIQLLEADCFSGSKCNSSVRALQEFYCIHAALGDFYPEKSECSNPTPPYCDESQMSQKKYFDLLEKDLENFWCKTLWPAVQTAHFDCSYTPKCYAEIAYYRPGSILLLLGVTALFM
eukprot:m.14316 g.14316  ORF g.14316 m.14316 type:complete len:414 (+) comp25679_c0_seq1:57-1298(+)